MLRIGVGLAGMMVWLYSSFKVHILESKVWVLYKSKRRQAARLQAFNYWRGSSQSL
jgi:hypothetical protein